MENKIGKYYYENVLGNQNITAKTNIVWAADITKLDLVDNQTAHIFLCIDIHTNVIVGHSISKETITSQKIIKVLEQAIKKRFSVVPKKKLIIQTDRGTQFSSKAYYNFTQRNNKYFIPSMARQNTPTDNPVAERFMLTLKKHKINNITIEEEISNSIGFNSNKSFSRYRACLNKYVKSINNTPNKKAKLGPNIQDKRINLAGMLMTDPAHPKARSEHIGYDSRLNLVKEYTSYAENVCRILEEVAARKAEIVDKTPFDTQFEDSLSFKLIDQRLEEIHALITNNPETTREYVLEALEPVESSLEELHQKIDLLLPKEKKIREVLPLRDPLDFDLLPVFMANAGNQANRRKDLKQSQLRIAYTLLYHTGLRINEIREMNEKNFQDAIASYQINVIHHKTKQAHIHVLSRTAVLNLKKLKPEFDVVFNKYQFRYLFGKEKPIHEKSLLRIMNSDLKRTCEINQIPYNIKSHSFRINMISNLLRMTSVQNTAQIIGHSDIKSTMSYQRYALSKDEIRKLLAKCENLD